MPFPDYPLASEHNCQELFIPQKVSPWLLTLRNALIKVIVNSDSDMLGITIIQL
ncbi:uncharacterized protein PHALS_13611 [Plasmopara halstedii]|uniref:Uncharacterized protein n=1 Tax=Plasmopara halstedii TaxID=4781 RepID=A0A0P1AQL8_PLAHL|nr:uncharacterized protein PHALS_13611 [Plasmopara halstedii]CEG43414.1 hypothetical protein PHALS_13611 [Plasmopara halstedii]|eukprot:XP_024579783.1 hypothetical protein PHALS_13611 [Plasmopara halstedii]